MQKLHSEINLPFLAGTLILKRPEHNATFQLQAAEIHSPQNGDH